MRKANYLTGIAAAVLLALLAGPLVACVGFTALCASKGKPQAPAFLPRSVPIYSDFDGDQRADKAELFSSGPRRVVSIRFANSRTSYLYFNSSGAESGQILTLDVNHDSYPDLIWISGDQPRALIWLNDGKGNFGQASDGKPNEEELNAFLTPAGSADPRIGPAGHNPVYASSPPGQKDSRLAAQNQYKFDAHREVVAIFSTTTFAVSSSNPISIERGPPAMLS